MTRVLWGLLDINRNSWWNRTSFPNTSLPFCFASASVKAPRRTWFCFIGRAQLNSISLIQLNNMFIFTHAPTWTGLATSGLGHSVECCQNTIYRTCWHSTNHVKPIQFRNNIKSNLVRGFDTRNEGNNGSACVKLIARMEKSCIQSLKQNFQSRLLSVMALWY